VILEEISDSDENTQWDNNADQKQLHENLPIQHGEHDR
jgi:hypothetical protein